MNPQMYRELLQTEAGGIYGYTLLKEFDEILRYYELYEGHSDRSGGDRAQTNWIKKLINDESRHMCARPPEIRIKPKNGARDGAAAEQLNDWLEDLLDRNAFSEQLLKAARDAFVGKRVALKLIYEPGEGVRFRFAPSLEFFYETDECHPRRVTKALFCYFVTADTVTDRSKQRFWKQRYQLEDGVCYLDEGLYDGYGQPVRIDHSHHCTGLDFVPVFVVVNGGLSGDLLGESDVAELIGGQNAYDRAKTDDLEALKFQMFGQKLFIDASPESMESIQIAPGAMIDLQSEPGSPHQARAQVLETTFAYGEHLTQTLDRLKDDMHELVSVPRITPDMLSGLGTSGKAMRALYWSLECRCEERWASGWDAMLVWLVDAALKLARKAGEKLPEIEYRLAIEHLYPVMDDSDEERAQDLSEVVQQARSRRSFLAKWQPDEDADAELRQIVREKQMLEDAYEGGLLKELGGA